ncbi:MAG: hypothetical protein Q9162_007806 [Coniocarpon cinnabarinum]
MASPTLPAESVFTNSATTLTDSPLGTIITPSKHLPAANPSHSRVSSKENVSPRTTLPPSQSSPPLKQAASRAKSNSLSFPLLVKPTATRKSAQPEKRSSYKTKSTLRIHVPQAAPDTSFLTLLASQERHVLELREELAKAEDSLSRLKSQWASHESKRRETEARSLHRMKSLRANNGPKSTQSLQSFTAGATTPREVYEEIQRRKEEIDQAKRSPRQRRFSGSRHMRALSLVSADLLSKFPDLKDTTTPIEKPVERQDSRQSTEILSSPNTVPPTPDLIHEDDDTTDTATGSQRSLESPKKPKHGVRASMQMAADFREGLWTFFEDLKQATYGEDARAPDGRSRSGSKANAQIRRDMQARHSSSHGQKPPKRHVQRHTWQIRPRGSQDSLVDADGAQCAIPNRQEDYRQSRPAMSPRTNTMPVETPRKSSVRFEKDSSGELWQTWDTPRTDSRATTPVPLSHNHSTDSLARTLKHSSEDTKRGPLPWPALGKLKPGQLTRTASQLMDEWEKSLNPPSTYEQVHYLQEHHEGGRPEPRPISKRSNSRLDEAYH